MDEIKIKRSGGFTGLPASGKVDAGGLAPDEKAALDALFARKVPLPPAPGADRFTYSVTRSTPQGTKTIDVPEHLLPASLKNAVKDQLP